MAASMSVLSEKTVTLDQMDYGHINKCDNEKELERILRALTSGREGIYPDLIQHCEDKLKSINPNNRGLRKQERVLEPRDLKQEELLELNHSMKEWEEEMQKETEHQVNGFGDHAEKLPPIRTAHTLKGNQKKKVDEKNDDSKSNRIRSYDYKAWDKYDADKECEDVDTKTHTSENKSKTTKVAISKDIDTSNLSEGEKHIKAMREKEKGNEAFKSGDFEEALSYYCRSITLLPIAASYNNRALVYLRLEKWKEAKQDCDTVLSMDGETQNLKAMLRRATACKERGQYNLAKADLLFVLEKEPNNARAKSILKDVNKLGELQKESKENLQDDEELIYSKSGKKMVIQEVEGDSDDEDKGEDGDGKEDDTEVTTSLKTEVQDSVEDSKMKEEKKKAEVINVPVLPKFPPNTEKLKSKAAEFFKTGRYGEAGDFYTKAIESLSSVLNQENVEIEHRFASSVLHNNRAACWLKQGNDKACIEDCNAVLEIKTWDIKAMTRRATAYEHLEKYAKSWVDYKSAYNMDFSMSLAQEGANRVAGHLKEIHGPRWREKVPTVPNYLPTNAGTFMEQKVVTAVETDKIEVPDKPTAKVATSPSVEGNKYDRETPKDENKSSTERIKDKGAIPKSKGPQATKISNKPSKNKKRNKAKSKSPRQDEKKVDQTKLEAEKEEKRVKIRQDLYEKLKNDGNEFVKKGDYNSAIEHYTRCITISPKEPASYTNRALCFLKLKKHISAINDCSEAIKLSPDNVKAFYRRSLARKAEGFYKEAERDIKKLLEIDPDNKAGKVELDALKKFAWNSARKKGGISTTEDRRAPEPRKKQLVIEEVDSSSSSDEGEFILPEDGDANDGRKTKLFVEEQKINEPEPPKEKIVFLDEKKEVQEPATKPTQQKSMLGSILKTNSSDKGPITPFEFGAQWGAISNRSNLAAYKAILDRVPPKDLPLVLSNKIDDHVISVVAKVALDHIKTDGDGQRAFELMHYLTKAKRFQMAAMFLSDIDQNSLRATFKALSEFNNKTFAQKDLDGLLNLYYLL